jgi:hypothetical protein
MLLAVILLVVPGALAGGLIGGLVSWRLIRRRPERSSGPGVMQPDPLVLQELDQAAGAWAMAHGRPEAEGLLADKLHLVYRLNLRRRGWRA